MTDATSLDDLMPELVDLVFAQVDEATLPACWAVCSRWARTLSRACPLNSDLPPDTGAPSPVGPFAAAATPADLELARNCAEALMLARQPDEYARVAANLGHLGLLRWAHAIGGTVLDEGVCFNAALEGHREVIEWARSLECAWDESACEAAARYGHRALLAWLRAEGCPWDEGTCRGAARGGHLDILQQARAQGCPWDASTLIRAADGGNLDVLRWARDNGLPLDAKCIGNATNAAALGGHLNVLQWLHSEGGGPPMNSPACTYAARGGHLEVLQWLRANGYPWDRGTALELVSGGHVELLQWAHANGLPNLQEEFVLGPAARAGDIDLVRWARHQAAADGLASPCLCAYAASGGQLALLQMLRADGCPLTNEIACEAAARRGHLEVLRWLRANGCPWDLKRVYMAAAEECHVAVLRWVRANHSIEDSELQRLHCGRWAQQAARLGNREMLAWLRDECAGFQWQHTLCSAAAYCGRLETLKWLRANGCPWLQDTCDMAAAAGHLRVLRWALDNGCPWAADEICNIAARSGHLHVLMWLRARGCSAWDERTCEAAASAGNLRLSVDERTDSAASKSFVAGPKLRKWVKDNGCPRAVEVPARTFS